MNRRSFLARLGIGASAVGAGLALGKSGWESSKAEKQTAVVNTHPSPPPAPVITNGFLQVYPYAFTGSNTTTYTTGTTTMIYVHGGWEAARS